MSISCRVDCETEREGERRELTECASKTRPTILSSYFISPFPSLPPRSFSPASSIHTCSRKLEAEVRVVHILQRSGHFSPPPAPPPPSPTPSSRSERGRKEKHRDPRPPLPSLLVGLAHKANQSVRRGLLCFLFLSRGCLCVHRAFFVEAPSFVRFPCRRGEGRLSP